MRSRPWMWISLISTFILGVSLGVLLDRHIRWDRHNGDHGSGGGRFMTKLASELELSSAQREDLERVLAANREKADDFWRRTRGSYGELRKEFRRQIRALLTPEQQKRFDAMMAREDALREERRKQGE